MQKIEIQPDAIAGNKDEMAALNKVEFGRRFSVSKRTVDQWLSIGCPHLKLSERMVRIPLAEATQWVHDKYFQQRRTV